MTGSTELRGVDFRYTRDAIVFRDLDLALEPGLTLLLGPNGSGKSSVMKLLAGIEKPDAGRVWIDGLDLWGDEAAARSLLAYVPELPDLTPYASIAEILRFVCRLRGEPVLRAETVARELDLEAVTSRSVRELSKGQRRRALLAAARIGEPRLLLLDEPLDALDRAARADVLSWIEEHCRAGGQASRR